MTENGLSGEEKLVSYSNVNIYLLLFSKDYSRKLNLLDEFRL